MKFFKALAILATTATTLVFAQDATQSPCMVCLQDSLQSLPACTGLKIVIGDMDPSSDPAYAACLCSSLDGAWVDKCIATCGQDIVSFKKAYSQNIQDAGLKCGAQPTFIPVHPIA
ncbi:hypothetical protein BGZ96_000860 [Linnemannia gamsii]|uniref:Extracellular membrane protein CFEM domain-containing protein n=1 Tax=Linnemannia gamsii TaxID=64522 RepID=A0ABQ7JN80_9FUNG|nr:hypothetical protein BGZ96_000860 [Linnemannia gamsii]